MQVFLFIFVSFINILIAHKLISKAQIKYINSLKLKKFRQENNQFIVEGIKMVDEIILSKYNVDSVFATENWIQKHKQSKNNFKLIEVTDEELKRISNLEAPNEALAIVDIAENKLDLSAISNELVLVLDNIQDPGNLGTIVRTADWFGIKNIICSENCVDIYIFKAVQSTMGSISRVNCYYRNLDDFLGSLTKGTKVYGALLNSDSIYSKELSDKGIIIIGNESKGISPEISKYVNEGISIPYFPLNPLNQKAESLNASVAASIICSEFRRRQL